MKRRQGTGFTPPSRPDRSESRVVHTDFGSEQRNERTVDLQKRSSAVLLVIYDSRHTYRAQIAAIRNSCTPAQLQTQLMHWAMIRSPSLIS